MKIAFISTVHGHGVSGADTLWLRAAEESLARGDKIFLGVTKQVSAHPRVQALLAGGAKLQHRSAPPWKRTRRQRLSARVANVFKRPPREIMSLRVFAPELVVISCGGTYDLALEPALVEWLQSSSVACRIIANFQQENPSLAEADRGVLAGLFRAAQSIIFVSERNAATTRRHLAEALPNAIVLHNPLRRIDPEPGTWPSAQPWRLAAVSRLDPVKGLDHLIRSFAAVPDLRPAAELHLYGDGPDRDRLKDLARQLDVSTRVHFRGYEPDLMNIWRNNHVLVSAAIDEGVPMTIPEAMLWGRPVIATPVGASTEWVVDGVTGFIAENVTLPALTAVLTDAWEQRARWEQMGKTAATTARAIYRPDDFLQLIAPPESPLAPGKARAC